MTNINNELVRNSVKVEARGSVAVITNSTTYELRLLGTSCHTDTELYKVTNSITLSLEKGKNGIVALSVCSPNKSVCGREIFSVEWIGENKDKIFINLMNPLSSHFSGVSENGFRVNEYNIPWFFLGDSEQSFDPQKVFGLARSYTGAGHKLFRDGNVFCRHLVGDADMNDIEASHLEYRMEDPGFLKQIAKEIVVLRQRSAEDSKELESWKTKSVMFQKEVDDLKAKLSKTIKALLYIKKISSTTTLMTWWKKLTRIRLVFVPLADNYVDVELK
jgi:hypothetical protein